MSHEKSDFVQVQMKDMSEIYLQKRDSNQCPGAQLFVVLGVCSWPHNLLLMIYLSYGCNLALVFWTELPV